MLKKPHEWKKNHYSRQKIDQWETSIQKQTTLYVGLRIFARHPLPPPTPKENSSESATIFLKIFDGPLSGSRKRSHLLKMSPHPPQNRLRQTKILELAQGGRHKIRVRRNRGGLCIKFPEYSCGIVRWNFKFEMVLIKCGTSYFFSYACNLRALKICKKKSYALSIHDLLLLHGVYKNGKIKIPDFFQTF